MNDNDDWVDVMVNWINNWEHNKNSIFE